MRKLFPMLLCGVIFVSFTACDPPYVESDFDVDGVDISGFIDGHGYVDLGLPSGTLWATCNVGATTPEEYGDYFAWGETEPKEDYYWRTYKYCNGSESQPLLTKYCTNSNYGTIDNKTTLEASDDAATANWGGDWHMPTFVEQQELLDECDWEWTDNYNNTGVAGRIVTGKNGNTIFLPAAGYRRWSYRGDPGSYGEYWSSSLDESDPHYAYYLYFNSDRYGWSYSYRYDGRSVRPVCSSR